VSRPARGLAFWAAAGGSGLLALTLVNVAANRVGAAVPGLARFRDYLVRRNG